MSKITFRLDPLFLVLAFGIGWLNSATIAGIFLWAIVVFVSILVHELGHALTAISFGQSAEVTFMPLGGLTSRQGGALSPLKEFIIVLNGPLAGFGLYFACRFFLGFFETNTTSPIAYMLLIGTYVNLIWTILNLLPILPLDGGKLLLISCEKVFRVRGKQIAYGISFLFSLLGAIFAFLIQELFAGAILSLFAYESYRGFALGAITRPIDTDATLKKELDQSIESYDQGHLVEAASSLQKIRDQAQEGVLYLLSTFYLAKVLEEQGHFEEGYQLLKKDQTQLDSEGLEVLQRLAFSTKRYQEASEIGQEAFREKPGPSIAYINALSLAQLNRVIPAVGWFETAIREGLQTPLLSSRHTAFDPIRDQEAFKRLVLTLRY